MGVFKGGAQEGPFGLRTCLAEEFCKGFSKGPAKGGERCWLFRMSYPEIRAEYSFVSGLSC